MRWRRLGHIYAPEGSLSWARVGAANPVAEHIRDDIFRIYFNSRDDNNRSSIGYVEIDITNPYEILKETTTPVLAPGDLAMFDDSGASIGCVIKVDGRRYLYYMGWHLTVTVPWQNTIGLAVSQSEPEHAAAFERHSRFPLFSLDETDPYTVSYPWVMRENGRFRMWYGSSTHWSSDTSKMRHVVKHAVSDDGITWHRDGTVAIDLEPSELAIIKPCVLREGNGYRMWFCVRDASYRIFSATSSDGITWTREPDPDLEPSENGWDSDMVEYPCVFNHKGRRYMIYAGNGFGRTGFGLAEWVGTVTSPSI